MARTRSWPSSVGFSFTSVSSRFSSSRYREMASISPGGHPCMVESVTDERQARGDRVGHAGDRRGVRLPGGPREQAGATGQLRGLAPEPLEQGFGRGVDEPPYEPVHLLRPDALEVVADAHGERERRGRGRGAADHRFREVQSEPRLQVLVVRGLQVELLGPLDVVALVGRVDAGLGDLEGVELLHGLQLDGTGAAEVRAEDVLRELGVRAGRGTEDREGRRRRGPEEVPDGDVEDRAPVAQLGERPQHQVAVGDRTHHAAHRGRILPRPGLAVQRRSFRSMLAPWMDGCTTSCFRGSSTPSPRTATA